MTVEKIYMENVYISNFQAKVTEIRSDLVSFNRTAFFPEGGGQSSDTGTVDNWKVTHVFEENGNIWHKIPDHGLSVGDIVNCTLDWEKRFDNMQRHLGEHIMSGVFHRLYQGINKGFHMGDNYMTIDISFENSPNSEPLTVEMLTAAEDEANRIIWENLPVTVSFFDKASEASAMPLRKPLTIEKNITVVTIGSIDNPADCVACCGTHPSSSGQVGIIKIFRTEKNKGMYRIYLDAGRRVLETMRVQDATISQICRKYSTGIENLPKKIQAEDRKYEELLEKYKILRDSVVNSRTEFIYNQISENKKGIFHFSFDDITIDDIMHIGRRLSSEVSGLLMMSSESAKTVLLFSNGTINCSLQVKNNIAVFNGKGGGNDTMARAVFSDISDMQNFITAIEMLHR